MCRVSSSRSRTALFEPKGEVRVRLINEALAAKARIATATSSSRRFRLMARRLRSRASPPKARMASFRTRRLDEFLVLLDGNPQGGLRRRRRLAWPAAPSSRPSRRRPPPAAACRTCGRSGRGQGRGRGRADRERGDRPRPEAVTSCQIDDLYNVIGFNENSNDLTPRLDEAARPDRHRYRQAEAAGRWSPAIRSTQGDYATNALFAIERAQNVLRLPAQAGRAVRAGDSATGAGETTQFGEELAANRRVVITVRP